MNNLLFTSLNPFLLNVPYISGYFTPDTLLEGIVFLITTTITISIILLDGIISLTTDTITFGTILLAESTISPVDMILQKQVSTTDVRPEPVPMDLLHRTITIPGGSRKIFIYDSNDHSATKLYALFAGKNYQVYTHEEIQGYSLAFANRLEPTVNGSVTARVPVLAPCVLAMEATGTIIYSRAMPIQRRLFQTGGLSLYIRRDL